MTNSNTAATLVNQKLQVQQGAASPRKPGKHVLPAGLLLVCQKEVSTKSLSGASEQEGGAHTAVGKLNMHMLQGDYHHVY